MTLRLRGPAASETALAFPLLRVPGATRETAAQILLGGASLYGFGEAEFARADKAAENEDIPSAAE